MKKLSLLVIAMSLVLLAACGSSQETAQGSNEEGESKVLTVLTDAAYPPFENLENGEIVGFDVDLLAAIMEEAGLEYELNHHEFDPIFISLQQGSADVGISAITINETRQIDHDFTTPYFKSTHMILVNEGTEVNDATDLIGKKIGVQRGTTGAEAARKLMGDKSTDVLDYDTTLLAIQALKVGDVEAVVTDNTVVEEYLKNNPDETFVAITDDENFETEYYGIALGKDSAYTEQIDAALRAIMENGTFAQIYEKWFGYEPNIEDLLNAK